MYAVRPLLSLFFFVFAACAADAWETSAQPFWDEFRQAIVDNDKEKIADMTQFPLEVRGPDDADPVKHYDRAKFMKLYERLITQQVFVPGTDQIRSKPMRQLLADKTDIVRNDFLTENALRVEQFEFERRKGQWRLTRAYLEE